MLAYGLFFDYVMSNVMPQVASACHLESGRPLEIICAELTEEAQRYFAVVEELLGGDGREESLTAVLAKPLDLRLLDQAAAQFDQPDGPQLSPDFLTCLIRSIEERIIQPMAEYLEQVDSPN